MGQDEQVRRRGVVAPEPEGRDQDELRRARAERGGQLRGDHPAEEVADQVGGTDAETVEELVVGQDQVEDVVERLDTARALDPGVERCVHRVASREAIQER